MNFINLSERANKYLAFTFRLCKGTK